MLLDKSYSILKKILLENIDGVKGSKILDAGCGWRSNFCAISPDSYYGIDNDQRVIDRLKKNGTGAFFVMDIKEL